MPITYVGAYLHEVTLALRDDDITRFDPLYAPYALTPLPYDGGHVFMTVSPILLDTPTFDNWFHFTQRKEGTTNNNSLTSTFFNVFGVGGNLLFYIERQQNSTILRLHLCGNAGTTIADTAITGLMPAELNVVYDFHLVQDATTVTLEMYIDGILQRVISGSKTAQYAPTSLQFSNTNNTALAAPGRFFISEIIITDAEPTINARLSSQRPTGLTQTNTWDGEWASLGDEDTGSGISTDMVNARITGFFDTYDGTVSPVGIRAMVQTNYFVDNTSGLEISSFLRRAGLNNDTVSAEYRDTSRVFTVWDTNPISGVEWIVTDLDTVIGGVRSVAA